MTNFISLAGYICNAFIRVRYFCTGYQIYTKRQVLQSPIKQEGNYIKRLGINCKNVWVWKDATCDATCGSHKNLSCVIAKGCPFLTTMRGSFSCRTGTIETSQNLSC